MMEKELTKIFMMISNRETSLVSMVCTKISALRVKTKKGVRYTMIERAGAVVVTRNACRDGACRFATKADRKRAWPQTVWAGISNPVPDTGFEIPALAV